MKIYYFESLGDQEFESLVVDVCSKILGIGVVCFTKGPDGARDARFEGKADKYPSEQEPWDGKFIIQAKHTSNPLATCSDGDFYENRTSILNKEIEKIKKLLDNGEKIDNYLLFTNRKYTGSKDTEIIDYFRNETGIKNFNIIGRETLNSLVLKNRDIERRFDLCRQTLRIFPEDIKDIIVAFSQNKEMIRQAFREAESIPDKYDLEEKNKLNKLSEDSFEFIKERSMPYFNRLMNF